jgi:hypothetical protein
MREKRGRGAGWTAALALMGVSAAGVTVGPAAADDGWRFAVTPYVWFPAVKGSIDTVVPGTPRSDDEPQSVNVSAQFNPDNYLSNLQFAAMLSAEARKDRWLLLTDLVYVSFIDNKTRVRTVSGPLGSRSTEIAMQANTDLDSTLWSLAGGYRVVQDPSATIDLLVGLRYFGLNNDLSVTLRNEDTGRWRYAQVSTNLENWDAIIGFKAQFLLGHSGWYIPLYADVGGGDSDLTWQAMGGLGYRFDWGSVLLAWRAIGYEFNDNQGDLTLNGPALGVSFRW